VTSYPIEVVHWLLHSSVVQLELVLKSTMREFCVCQCFVISSRISAAVYPYLRLDCSLLNIVDVDTGILNVGKARSS
jgi:hypothetical protein